MRKMFVSACFRIFKLFFYRHFKELPEFKVLVAADALPALADATSAPKYQVDVTGSILQSDGTRKDIDFTNANSAVEISNALFGDMPLSPYEEEELSDELLSLLKKTVSEVEDAKVAKEMMKSFGPNFVYNPETKMATVFSHGQD